MFTRKFWIQVGEAFVIAAVVSLMLDPTALLAIGSLAQLKLVAIAVLRGSAAAGFRAVAPFFLRFKKEGANDAA